MPQTQRCFTMTPNRFDPDSFLHTWTEDKYSPLLNGKSFAGSIREAFNIPTSDQYIYRAQAETTLDITQKAIAGKRAHGLHGWYGTPVDPQYPLPEEIRTYTELFNPSLNLTKALNGYHSNSKAQSIRSHVAKHLHSRIYNTTSGLLPSKKDRAHLNPYFTFWIYACQELEWAGPIPSTAATRISHHILPVFYHHFGCVVPSYAALHVIAKLSQPTKPSKQPVLPILDIGSGNGYWTYMLRNFPIESVSGAKELDVRAVDSQVSEYRFSWITDTVKCDGLSYLMQNGNGVGCVLLLVYPQATGDFTGPILKTYEGDTIIVAGTQNSNGFTAFQDYIVDEWIDKNLTNFILTLRMPLPSFAGKDEALFVFQRKK